ncbi:BofC C-terminal domain-containing protein [Tissierella sp.]|uniref:BofC C-terminal domain-containing protein n=1 Tax=Tissierella sp. TaxID=41274 RepID=UPI00286194B1|nr:BofC C-terminal domain-containing protein [Tissierella sp.]MDR7856439.1 BofC C-terminal domain-containing protein [Tissierella sp.]
MNRDKIVPVFFFSLTLFLISFILGYQLMGRKLNPNNNISQLDTEEMDIYDSSDLEILKEDTKLTPNTFIEKRIHYATCNHIVSEVDLIENELVNMSRSEFTQYLENSNPSEKLISFSSSKVTLAITKNHLCPNHYIVGEYNGIIAIFSINENGERVLDKVFEDYPISLLMEIDQQKIKEGIVVDSEEELSEILENFIS